MWRGTRRYQQLLDQYHEKCNALIDDLRNANVKWLENFVDYVQAIEEYIKIYDRAASKDHLVILEGIMWNLEPCAQQRKTFGDECVPNYELGTSKNIKHNFATQKYLDLQNLTSRTIREINKFK